LLNPIHVALIDDAESTRLALARLLLSAGFQPAVFASAEEFLGCNELQFDCLLLDVHLPGLSGLDLFRALRREGRCTPVVFLTGDRDVSRNADLRDAGISCLLKPADDVTLFTALRKAVDSPVS
jgi:FixJ family two-component response regulator